MRKILLSLMVPVGMAIFLSGSPAQAKEAPRNHGQCVSSSPQPSGKGGRSEVARNKEACAPTPAPQLDCAENGVVDLNSEANTVELTANAATAGSSLECAVDIAVTAGQTLSFTYDLSDGVTCGGGVPRLFITIDGQTYNTFDGGVGGNGQPLAGACGGGNVGEATSGTVTYTIPVSGTATTIGLVYDFSTGSVVYSDVTLDGQPLNI